MKSWWVALAVVSSACSVISVRGPERPTERGISCDPSYAAPAADLVGVGIGVVFGLLAAVATDPDEVELFWPSIAGILVYGASAGYGFATIARCDRAKEREAMQIHVLSLEALSLATRGTALDFT